MTRIRVRPHLYRQFGETEGIHFRFITNTSIATRFLIEDDGRYETTAIEGISDESDIERLIANLPRPLHVLVVLPETLFQSPRPDVIGDRCKLLVIPCNSTEVLLADIEHYLQVMEATDPLLQKEWADRFFALGEASSYLRLVDETLGTEATFKHLSDEYEWFEQLGPLTYGGQQFAPAGEISVLPLFHGNYDAGKRLKIDGTIALYGLPIVNSGKPSFLRSDQNRIYDRLAALNHEPLIATVKNGEVQDLEATSPAGQPTAKMLETMFDVDSRYRIIWEVGFGANTSMQVINSNRSPNESFGHRNGAIHWGLGLTPWTQYHIDIICPNTLVLSDKDEILAGGDVSYRELGNQPALRARMCRTAAVGCPCIV